VLVLGSASVLVLGSASVVSGEACHSHVVMYIARCVVVFVRPCKEKVGHH
jgi:hypothetical protein